MTATLAAYDRFGQQMLHKVSVSSSAVANSVAISSSALYGGHYSDCGLSQSNNGARDLLAPFFLASGQLAG